MLMTPAILEEKKRKKKEHFSTAAYFLHMATKRNKWLRSIQLQLRHKCRSGTLESVDSLIFDSLLR
jgi:hypothetical protein